MLIKVGILFWNVFFMVRCGAPITLKTSISALACNQLYYSAWIAWCLSMLFWAAKLTVRCLKMTQLQRVVLSWCSTDFRSAEFRSAAWYELLSQKLDFFLLAPILNLLWRLRWSSVLLNLGAMTSETLFLLPIRFKLAIQARLVSENLSGTPST